MKVLVINCGSSSLKYQMIDSETEQVLAKGLCERIAIEGSMLTHQPAGKDKIKKEHLKFSHFVIYLKYAKGNAGLKAQEFSDIVEVLNKINPEAEIKWGYSENGFRNELFIIMAR